MSLGVASTTPSTSGCPIASSSERAAHTAPKGEFVLFEDGNHVCANVPYKARPLVADWLREQLA